MSNILKSVAAAAAMLTISQVSSHAQATRTWVTGSGGSDANTCSRTAPCQTFAGAIVKTFINGIIDCIDAGAYGAVTITKSITIDCHEAFAGVLASGTTGIVINIPAGNANDPLRSVRIRNLIIDGTGASGAVGTRTGINGIRIDSASSVFIEDTLIRNFTQNGIRDQRSTGGELFINNTTVQFETTADNQTVVLTYNAECVVDAARGTRLNIRVLVDGNQADPSDGTDFSLCSAVDTDGLTWVSAVRQSVMNVPIAGTHFVKIVGRMFGGTGTWRLDDSSLVVQRAAKVATREDIYESTSTDSSILIPLRDNDSTVLNVTTTKENEPLKITYNAECVIAGLLNRNVGVRIFAPDAAVFDGTYDLLCSAVDTAGKTWAGAARQTAITIPNAGNHAIHVQGGLSTGPGTWRLNDSALVVTRGFLASGLYDGEVSSLSTSEVEVPIRANGGKTLAFSTTDPNQVVKLTFNALCLVGAERGRWLGIRVTVDDVEAAPASGYDFALCASVTPGYYNYVAGFRQSVITVPTPGSHTVRVFAKVSSAAAWGMGQISMVVE